MGMMSLVRLMAIMPATRAQASTSPFSRAVLQHHGLRLGVHEDGALGDGDAMGLGLVGHVDHAYLALGVHVCQLVAACSRAVVGSTGRGLRACNGIAGRSRNFVGRHRGPASGLGGIGVPALGHMIILRFGT